MQFQLPGFPRVELAAATALKTAILLWAMLAIGAVFAMSLGTDEAWVLNGLRSALRPPVPYLSTELIITSGGAFAIANLGIEWIVGNKLWVHRMLSLLCLGLSVILILRARLSKGVPGSMKWIMLAPMIAIPGAAEVGSAALGTSTGLLLMVAAMLVWTSPGDMPLANRVIGAGPLYGLAAASRFDLVLFGPALLAASSMRLTPAGRLDVRFNSSAWALVVIGAGVFLVNLWLMSPVDNSLLAQNIGGSTGLKWTWAVDYPRLLNQWLTASTFAPISLLALMVVSAFWLPSPTKGATYPQGPSLEALLAITGLVLFAGWLFRAPIPHLRYAFPALFCFAALGAIGLQRIATHAIASGAGRQWLLCQCIGLACVIGAIGSTARSLVMSDSDIASWEWTHEMPYDYFRRFEAVQHQTEVAAFLRQELPPDARLYSYVPYALRYLTERPLVDVDRAPFPDRAVHHANRYLVLTPAVGTYFYMNTEAAIWIQTKATLAKQIGRYSVYKLPAGNDDDLENLKLRRTDYEGHPNSRPWFGR